MPGTSRTKRRLGVALIIAMSVIGTPILANIGPVDAVEFDSGGFVTSARVDRTTAPAGQAVAITASVKSSTTRKALIQVQVDDQAGRKVFQTSWDNRSLKAGQAIQLGTSWSTAGLAPGPYTVKIGVFAPRSSSLLHWNDQAASASLTDPAAPTTTAVTTTTLPSSTTTVATILSSSVTANPSTVPAGATVTVSAAIRTDVSRTALVDVEAYSSSGERVFQFWWDNQSLTAGESSTLSTTWTLPSSLAPGSYTFKIGVFGTGWGPLVAWNEAAGTMTVSSSPTTTAPATTTPTTTAPPPTSRFATLPVGAELPSGAECATRVRPAAEIRSANATENALRGSRINANTRSDWAQFSRVDGDFVGTTDEIIQWAACKWGIDEDIARAQVIKESNWYQSTNGDNGESWGLGQVRDTSHQSAFQYSVNARTSSSYNLDYTYASWRACYEGVYTWLNTVERNGTYASGDVWGCLGVWFSGRWYVNTDAYLNQTGDSVRWHYGNRTWLTANFINS